jgi:hypothetical protein
MTTTRRAQAVPVTVEAALTRSLTAMVVLPEDEAARELAYRYARTIDANPDDAVKVGPLLLAVLDALGMTPKARAATVKPGAPATASKLDELRAARERKVRA